MKISVAMCTYNGSDFVRDQLESLANQTRLPDELIVCDDNSRDETANIVSNFAKNAPFPVHLHVNSENLGVVKNFEKAVGLCNGDLIALSDQDDVWLPEKLLLEEEVFRSYPRVGLVFTNAEVVDENLEPLGFDLWSAVSFSLQKRKMVLEGRAFEVLLKKNFVTGTTMMFRRQLLEACLPFPCVTNEMIKGGIFHDHWIALVTSAIAEIKFIDKKLVKYRQHSSQLIGASIATVNAKQHINKFSILPSASVPFNFKPNESRSSRGGEKDNFSPFIDNLDRKLRQLRRLEEALSRHRERLIGPDLLSMKREITDLEERITHLRARQMAHTSGSGKGLALIVRELSLLRYHKYSNGVRSALKDFILCLI